MLTTTWVHININGRDVIAITIGSIRLRDDCGSIELSAIHVSLSYLDCNKR